jgi:hypothetical protein
MKMLSPKTLLIIGFSLALTGAFLPFLMVIHVLDSTFFLNFFSFGAQVTGLFLGMIGAAYYVSWRKR